VPAGVALFGQRREALAVRAIPVVIRTFDGIEAVGVEVRQLDGMAGMLQGGNRDLLQCAVEGGRLGVAEDNEGMHGSGSPESGCRLCPTS
jgi:hypothetical protein